MRRVRSLRWPGADAQEQGLGRQEAGAQHALQRGRGRLQSHDLLLQHVIQLQLRGRELQLAFLDSVIVSMNLFYKICTA